MKLTLLIITLLFIYNEYKAMSNDISLELLYPNSGGKFEQGDNINIKWHFINANDKITILLWDGRTKVYYPIAENVKSELEAYSFNIPDNIEGDRFRIKLITNSSVPISDMSDSYFSIKKKSANENMLKVDLENIDKMIEEYTEEEATIRIAQNHPNPFSSLTELQYFISKKEPVKLTLYDLNGKSVANLIDRYVNAGWNTLIVNGSGLIAGAYILKLESNGKVAIKTIQKSN